MEGSRVIGESEAMCVWCEQRIKGELREVLGGNMHPECEQQFQEELDDVRDGRPVGA